MLTWLFVGLLVVCLLGIGNVAWNPRETRQQYLWGGACVLAGAGIPDAWLAATVALVGVSCFLKFPPGLTALSVPPILAWVGLYVLLSNALPTGGWLAALEATVAVGATGGVFSLLKWRLRRGSKGEPFVQTIQIPWTQKRLVIGNRGLNEAGWFDNSSIGGIGFAAMLPAAAGLVELRSWWWLLAAAGLVLGLVLSKSWGGWAALGAAMVGYAACRAPLAAWSMVALGSPLVAAVAWKSIGRSNWQDRIKVPRATWSLWQTLPLRLKVTGAGPWGWWFWLGPGRENFGLPPTRQALAIRPAGTSEAWSQAHNEWLQGAFEHGPLVLVAAGGFLATTFIRLLGSSDAWAGPIAGGLAALVASSVFLFPLRVPDLALMLLVWLVGAARMP